MGNAAQAIDYDELATRIANRLALGDEMRMSCRDVAAAIGKSQSQVRKLERAAKDFPRSHQDEYTDGTTGDRYWLVGEIRAYQRAVARRS